MQHTPDCTFAKPCDGQARHMATPRTQKARSVFTLAQYGLNVPSYQLIQEEYDLDATGVLNDWPRFARPCPVMPRHGFVDSRIVNSLDEAKAVFAEARAADPQAEMLLMKPINAKANAVLTPGSVTFGPGHDGATQGKECVTFPLTGCAVEGSALETMAGITEWPYVEAVFSTDRMYFTQLRNGPRVGGTQADRIPANVTVRHVITLDPLPDALEWETRCAGLPSDTAIYHPGGSQTSHYAVHAALRGLAVFTTRPPQVGEQLKANVGAVVPYDLPAFRKGTTDGLAFDCVQWLHTDPKRGVRIGLFAVHHAMALRNGPGSWLFGFGVAMLVRHGITASCGEARYARGRSKSRSEIYENMLSNPVAALKRGTQLFRLFMEHWKEATSVGGPAWAKCTKATLDLDYALRRAYHEGTDERFNALIAAAHNMVNCAHNGGWYLNKFCSKKHFDRHASADMGEILETAALAYDCYQSTREWPVSNAALAWSAKRKARLLREGKRAVVIMGRYVSDDTFRLQYRRGRGGYQSVDVTVPDASADWYNPRKQVRDWYDSLVPGPSLSGSKHEYRIIRPSQMPQFLRTVLAERSVI